MFLFYFYFHAGYQAHQAGVHNSTTGRVLKQRLNCLQWLLLMLIIQIVFIEEKQAFK